jgi:hypothetical protein
MGGIRLLIVLSADEPRSLKALRPPSSAILRLRGSTVTLMDTILQGVGGHQRWPV